MLNSSFLPSSSISAPDAGGGVGQMEMEVVWERKEKGGEGGYKCQWGMVLGEITEVAIVAALS